MCYKVIRGQGLQHCEQMDVNKGKKGKRGMKQERMNNKLALLLKRHQVSIVFKTAERKQAISKKRKKTMVEKWRETGRDQLHFRIAAARSQGKEGFDTPLLNTADNLTCMHTLSLHLCRSAKLKFVCTRATYSNKILCKFNNSCCQKYICRHLF